MPKFQHILITCFLLTFALEMFAIFTHRYTISDFVLTHIRMSYRVESSLLLDSTCSSCTL
jgi:hypothetical protein